MRLQRIRDGTLGRPPGAPAPNEPTETTTITTSKKRKADDEEDIPAKKKRTNGVGDVVGESSVDGAEGDHSNASESEEPASALSKTPSFSYQLPPLPSEALPPSKLPMSPSIDESEWAAFERDVASPPPQLSVLTSTATISAAPLTAAEVAAQSRQEASLQAKERREAETEGETEDAARMLEEEFEQMAELEERLNKMRERDMYIKANRGRISQNGNVGDPDDADEDVKDDSSSFDDEDWDNWGR